MSAPMPLAGANPYTGAYQSRQFDSTQPTGMLTWGASTVFDDLANPPAGAEEAAESPDVLFDSRVNPPVGADGNEPSGAPGS